MHTSLCPLQGKESEESWLLSLLSGPQAYTSNGAGRSPNTEEGAALQGLFEQGYDNGDNVHCFIQSFVQVGGEGCRPGVCCLKGARSWGVQVDMRVCRWGAQIDMVVLHYK